MRTIMRMSCVYCIYTEMFNLSDGGGVIKKKKKKKRVQGVRIAYVVCNRIMNHVSQPTHLVHNTHTHTHTQTHTHI
jgi:hypothetical protein